LYLMKGVKEKSVRLFSRDLARWQKRYGRHNLPWQNTGDPYKIWLSEIMLQQTQVTAVIPYFHRFLKRFPDLDSLASARTDMVLALWSGLGYYSRARNLHATARLLKSRFQGRFPRLREQLESLPGVGRSTAGAIAVFAFGQQEPILDGNVKRVLCRYFGIKGYPGLPRIEKQLWEKAEGLLPDKGIRPYTQGLMDLGSLICTRRSPDCRACPVSIGCKARREGSTHLLPSSKKAKSLPERETTMLIVSCRNRFLLVKRPDKGIWGGLLSFPELPEGKTLKNYCGKDFGITAKEVVKLPPFNHSFTHFHLTIKPLMIKAEKMREQRKLCNALWLSKPGALKKGISAPVRRILAGLAA
jgi:A/G-specific adenine glycosylase